MNMARHSKVVEQRAALAAWHERQASGQERGEAEPLPHGASERRYLRALRARAMVELARVWMHPDRALPRREADQEG
ncbi:MAG TPA: hypothetical protein VIN35_02290 [Hydrogenophaga sp.]